MYLNELVQVAKEDNKALIIWVNRWMLRGANNPIPDAFLLAKGIFWGFLGFVWTVLTIAWIAFVFYSSFNATHLGVASAVFVFNAATLIIIGFRIGWIKRRVNDKQNCFDFLEMISLIQKLSGENLEFFWTEENISACSPLLKRYLIEQAQKLKRLEKVPWRAKEEKSFRKKFDKEFQMLSRLGLLSADRRDYFQDQPMFK